MRQIVAFATGVPPYIYAFHRYTWTDLVLLDIKEFNNVRHRQLTERSNEQTIRTAEWLEKNGKPHIYRCIP